MQTFHTIWFCEGGRVWTQVQNREARQGCQVWNAKSLIQLGSRRSYIKKAGRCRQTGRKSQKTKNQTKKQERKTKGELSHQDNLAKSRSSCKYTGKGDTGKKTSAINEIIRSKFINHARPADCTPTGKKKKVVLSGSMNQEKHSPICLQT